MIILCESLKNLKEKESYYGNTIRKSKELQESS